MIVEWDPRRLCPDDRTARIELDEVVAGCRQFAARYRERVAALSAAELAACVTEFASLRDTLMRLTAYGTVRVIAALDDPAAADLGAAADEAAAEAGGELSFLVEEWRNLDRARALELCAAPELAAHRGVLLATHDQARPPSSTVDETLLAARDPAAVDAWAHLYDLVTGQIRVEVHGRRVGVDEALGFGRSPDRALRREADERLYLALAGRAGELAHCLDTVVADRLMTDQLREVAHPRAERDAENGVAAEHVDAALRAVAEAAGTGHEWYARKAAWHGAGPLGFAHVAAPLGRPFPVRFDDARAAVEGAFGALGADLGAVAAGVFAEHRVDATPRAHKLGNSLCVPAGTAPPFVLVNFAGQPADVITLGHEIGHAVHYTLAAGRQGPLGADPPVLIGEVAATFAELLVFDHLLAACADPDARAALLGLRADTCVAGVFRQAALTGFEDQAYARRARGEVLSAERLGAEWLASMRAAYGPAVAIDEPHGAGWTLVPHFFRTRYYNYSYVLAWLSSLILYRVYRTEPRAGAERLRELLRTGDTASSTEQLRNLGVAPEDPRSWARGLGELATLVADAA